MYEPKISVILSNVGSCFDRFTQNGYSDPYTIEEMFDRVASIKGVKGVEIVWTMDFSDPNIKRIKDNLERTGLELVSIIPDHFSDRKWVNGAFTSKDPAVRQAAVETTQKMMDIAYELGCPLLNLWPGQDGYDYPLQVDYLKESEWLIEGLKACCTYRNDVKISLEYKIKEPRNFSYIATVSNTLLMLKDINEDNCGITIDYGHAHVAYENVAESVALLKKHGNKLFHLHMNDNYGYWDDDMITGSIHTIPYIELFYWLKRTDYSGWISTDQYPYREESRDAVEESVRWIESYVDIVNNMDEDKVESILQKGDAVASSRFMRNLLLGK